MSEARGNGRWGKMCAGNRDVSCESASFAHKCVHFAAKERAKSTGDAASATMHVKRASLRKSGRTVAQPLHAAATHAIKRS